ncbi:hypothetical protein QUB60_16140 [Microcoleus sp. A2-C5]|uniref:hypothetical protein n=1 Tax=Microcoleus sp. A2-C2 TaxID=2818530 RepID=UPI002FD1DFE1
MAFFIFLWFVQLLPRQERVLVRSKYRIAACVNKQNLPAVFFFELNGHLGLMQPRFN